MKKRADIHFNTIVGIILALLVLIVIYLIFSGTAVKFFSSLKSVADGVLESFKGLSLNESIK